MPSGPITDRKPVPARTGLPGRDQLEVEIVRLRQTGHPAKVLLITTGGLLMVNSQLGWISGNEFVEFAAKELAKVTRNSGDVFHLGGNRFLLLLKSGIEPRLASGEIQSHLPSSVTIETISFPFLTHVTELGDLARVDEGDSLWRGLAAAEAEIHLNIVHQVEELYKDCHDLSSFAQVTIRQAHELFGASGVSLTLWDKTWSEGPLTGTFLTFGLDNAGNQIGTLKLSGVRHYDDPLEAASFRSISRTMAAVADRIRYREEALHDPLTGLLNRRGIEKAIGSIEGPMVIALLDVDRFKTLNDTHGHRAGDEALQKLARLLDSGRPSDVVGRWGGEEFVVILPGTDRYGMRTWLQRTMGAARSAIRFGSTEVTFSAGIAAAHGSEDFVDALARADSLLYAAKEKGRARILDV